MRHGESHAVAVTLLVGVSLLLSACGDGEPEVTEPASREAEPVQLTVYTVNYPLQYFAERIGGDAVRVVFPAPADGDPAYWKPDAEMVSSYQKADVILLNGASYAKWIDRVSLPTTRLVDTSVAFQDRLIQQEETVAHAHGLEGEHEHTGFAFTTWLDPTLAIEQARAVKEAVARRLPEKTGEVESRLAGLEEDLMAIDAAIDAVVSRNPDRLLVMSHPVYQYFTRRYELNTKSVHWEPDEAPTQEMWQDFQALLAEHPAQCMIWEGEPMEETVAALQEMGIASVVFSPCGNVPEEGDFLTVMRQNVAALELAFPDEPQPATTE